MYNQVCPYTKTLTFLNKLDKRISSLLPFPVTLLIDFLERKECLSVHLPQRAMLPQVFKAKQSTMIMKRTVLALAEQRLILLLQFLLPPSACTAQLPRRGKSRARTQLTSACRPALSTPTYLKYLSPVCPALPCHPALD